MLPNTLSALIRVALADLRKVEADPLYKVDMLTWHQPQGKFCVVCLAGAVMAQTLDMKPSVRIASLYGPFDTDDADKLLALDMLRIGDVDRATEQLAIDTEGPWEHIETPPDYDGDPEPFHAFMSDLADRLEAKGL